MNRYRAARAVVCVLTLAWCGGPQPAWAQATAASPPADTPVPHPPRAKSVLGVPVVRPPAAARRRKPPVTHHPAGPTINLPSVSKPPAKPTVPKAGAAAVGAAAGAAGAAAGAAPAAAEPPKPDLAKGPDLTKGSVTGLPLPRWVAFRSDDVNLRSGPGTQYPIEWQYHRRNLPVHITREFDAWRLVIDPDGIKGWVHQATLTGRRGFMIKDAERTLRGGSADDASAVALLKPGVVGYVRACALHADWCEVQAGDYRGWLRRTEMYGVEPDEAIN